MTDDKIERAIQVGRAAKQLLDTPILVQAFEEVEEDMVKAWKTTRAASVEERERLYIGLTMLEAVRNNIARKVQDGMAAEAGIEEEKMYMQFANLNKTPGEMM